MLDFEQQTIENTKAIGVLTGDVRELVTTMKHTEEGRKAEADTLKELTRSMNGLSDKISTLMNLQERVATLESDVRVVRHDQGNLKQAQEGLPLLNEKLNTLSNEHSKTATKAEASEKILDQNNLPQIAAMVKTIADSNLTKQGERDGMSKAATALWAIGSSIVTLLGGALYVFTNFRGLAVIGGE